MIVYVFTIESSGRFFRRKTTLRLQEEGRDVRTTLPWNRRQTQWVILFL